MTEGHAGAEIHLNFLIVDYRILQILSSLEYIFALTLVDCFIESTWQICIHVLVYKYAQQQVDVYFLQTVRGQD